MDIWISMHNSQMANNIVKWWKTKFLNGYKQFSVVECGDGKVSDTEELLGLGSEEDANERLRTACTTPPLREEPSPTPPESTPKKSELNFEEFSCDVSIENNDRAAQEFSFTLYDFDGHGKITKDDIAGLVTTIYEALGSSVKVPHYGSQTIKVKLTVAPDQRKHVSATIIDQKDNNKSPKPQETSIRYKKDFNVTISESQSRRRCRKQRKERAKKHQCCHRQHEEEQDDAFVSDDSSECSRVSGNATSDEEECTENVRPRPKKHHRKYYRNSPRFTIPNVFKEANLAKVKAKKRSGSLQRQELLEIIQANMDKNNLSFQTPRKHSSHESAESKQSESSPKHASKSPKSPLQYLANIVDPTHLYVDLASLQNTTQLPQTPLQYDKLIDAVMCVSKSRQLERSKCKKHDDFRYQFLKYPMTNDENRLKSPKKADAKEKNPQVANGHTSSPHHLRHRNRQEDQARAMAQVVHWLEQEFSNNLNTRERAKNHKEKTAPSQESVERHEHHHVHEHIHHHYHHYHDTPLVV